MKCKAFLLYVALSCVMLITFTVKCECKEIELSENNSILDIELSEDVKQVLESVGITDITVEKLSQISFSDTIRAVADIFKGSLKKPFISLYSLIGILIFSAVGSSYVNGRIGFQKYYDTASSLFVALFSFSGAVECIDTAVDSMYAGGIMMKSLVPVVAALTTAMGTPSMAISYNAVSMYCAQVISALCRNVFSPVICVLMVISVCTGINSLFNFTPVLNSVKKFVNVGLGLCGTVFTGILALKDVLAVGIDKVAVKGVKFVIGSAVPVVGSALSEGLSSIIASVSLMRNTYGTIGIIVVIAVTLPAVCELIMWIVTFSVSGYVAQTLGLVNISSILESIRYVLSMLLSILLFTVYILIISSAMIILLGGSR